MTEAVTRRSLWKRITRSISPEETAILLLVPLLVILLLAGAGSHLVAPAITLVTLFYAAVGATAAWLALRTAQQERKARNRPTVRVDCPVTSSSEVFLRITNTGLGAAMDVQVSFSPVPIDMHGRSLAELSLFKGPISVLMPGQAISHLFHVGFRLLESDQPKAFEATAIYRDDDGESYSETWPVDLDVLRDVTLPRPSVAEQLGKIAKTLAEITKTLKERPAGLPGSTSKSDHPGGK